MVSLPHWPKNFIRVAHIKDLSRTQRLLKELGDPHLKLPPVIHVAGTNGKGSTCAMLKSIFMKAGYKVHLYTSPHLLYFNERIELAGNKISDDFLFEVLETTRLACKKIGLEPNFSESVTAAAFLAFSKIKADILILETGVGGRLDPTNIIPFPLVSTITPISYDHMSILGDHISQIASEKAGIIKQNRPCVISRQDQEVMDILLKKCEETNSPAIAYEYDFIPEKTDSGFDFLSRLGNFEGLTTTLLGDHQIINASAVIASILLLKNKFNISAENIAAGIASANWPGRLQKFNISPLVKAPHNAKCWLDGAHNIAGAAALAEWARQQEFDNLVLIIGLTKNRDVASFLRPFLDLNPQIYAVCVKSEASSYSAEVIVEKSAEIGAQVISCEEIEEAINLAVVYNKKARIIITGSLFLVADCLKLNS